MQNATARPLTSEALPSGSLSPLRPAKVTWAELGCPTKVGTYMDAKYRLIRVTETDIAEAQGHPGAVFWLLASEPMDGLLSYRLGSRIGAELTGPELEA
jgi:hypothetical protein